MGSQMTVSCTDVSATYESYVRVPLFREQPVLYDMYEYYISRISNVRGEAPAGPV
jgi:hypothetical protein